MRNSPIQLRESFFLKVHVEPRTNNEGSSGGDVVDGGSFDRMDLQFFDAIDHYPEYWQDDEPPSETAKEHTYRVTLGVRTAEGSAEGAYEFEVIVSGTVACVNKVEGVGKLPEVLAKEYGLTLLFGMVREYFANITARMNPGLRLLPTVTFLGSAKKTVSDESAEEGKAPPPSNE